MARYLSKSQLLAVRQCRKRLHLEVRKPELAEVDAAAVARMRAGREVGELARTLYDDGDGALIPWEGGAAHALEKTARLLERGPRQPVFEATVEYRGVLVRIDLLVPHGEKWRLVEVKSAARVKDEYAFDCALQAWVFEGAGHPLDGIALAHVDNRFEYPGDGDYRGLLVEKDMAEEVAALAPSVGDWVRRARDAADGDEPPVPVGKHCFSPHRCPFVAYCWPLDADYPLFGIPRADKAKLAEFVAAGYHDVRDVPPSALTAGQRRVQRAARAGKAERVPGAAAALAALGYPRYYLDVETVAPAVPIFPGTRPYQALPFQWSCHYEAAPGELAHAGFLDLTGEAPMRRVAESLLRALGREGPVFTYSSYERQVIRDLARRYPDLAPALDALLARLVDLRLLTERHYYHPEMHGSWSLKALLPHIGADIDYRELEGIQLGTDASEGYLEAIAATTESVRRAELEAQLERYCRYDTVALVRLAAFLAAE